MMAAVNNTVCVCADEQFAELAFDGLHDNLLLFVHDKSNPNVLQRLTSASQLTDGALVEVVLSGNYPSDPSALQPLRNQSSTTCDRN